MQQKRDYYEVLGVPKHATLDEIKKAYRQLALVHHPDRCVGDKQSEELFKDILEAYDVLSDDDKRRNYDQFGHNMPFQQHNARNPHDMFGDFFNSFFGQQNHTPQTRDVQMPVDLSFVEAALGCAKKVQFDRTEQCKGCHGSGAKDSDSLEKCKLCDGQGRIMQGNGFIRVQSTCPQCRGKGKVIINPCTTCSGKGVVSSQVEIEVKIPEGAFNGMRLCVKEQGETVEYGGARGDLFLVIVVGTHSFFNREDEHLYCTVPVSYSTVVSGGKINVPGLNGMVDVVIKPGTQSGEIIRLPHNGIVDVYYPSRRGDMFVTIEVATPKDISEEYAEIITKLAEFEIKYPSERITEFEKVKVKT